MYNIRSQLYHDVQSKPSVVECTV